MRGEAQGMFGKLTGGRCPWNAQIKRSPADTGSGQVGRDPAKVVDVPLFTLKALKGPGMFLLDSDFCVSDFGVSDFSPWCEGNGWKETGMGVGRPTLKYSPSQERGSWHV